jgi:hypothetical protein
VRVKKKPQHLVVDGSNIATEGRQLPSLAQLEEAVEAFLAEHRFEHVIVVVDATFGHRISPKERKWFDEAISTNRMITPPAGAIGRGDAFILEIARRANATILSNDSFQEFHGTNEWLFDEGRLYGGKPVPHIGWVFVARSPVRGPTSRRAVKNARTTARAEPAETPAPSRALTTTAIAHTDAPVDTAPSNTARRRSRRRAASEEAPSEKNLDVDSGTHAVATTTTKRAGTTPSVAAATAVDTPPAKPPRARRTAAKPPAEPPAPPAAPRHAKAFNEPEKYGRFRDAHPVGSIVELTVDRFSSHGAYGHAGDVEIYIPTKLLGTPPPQRARDVLHIGELVALIVERYDDATRGIDARAIRMDDDIAYYASSRASTATRASVVESSAGAASRDGSEQPTRRSELVATKKKAAAKRAPAKKKAPAKKAPAKKKAAAKKAPAKRKAAAKKKAPAKKKAAAKKAPAKKRAPAKKKAAAKKKAPAKKRATAKKAAKRTAKKRG